MICDMLLGIVPLKWRFEHLEEENIGYSEKYFFLHKKLGLTYNKCIYNVHSILKTNTH